MADITTAFNWAVSTCAQKNVGYSQKYRNRQTVNGVTYYDCSSFIWFSLIAGGFDPVKIWGTWPFTTSTMAGVLKQMGFKLHSPSEKWTPGDVLIKTGHTEMAFDSTRTMGAHTDKVPLDKQVSINANDSRNNGWLQLWRWETGATVEWIKGNRYLPVGEMQNNATLIFAYFLGKGWSAEAVSGMMGNIQKESTVNPGIWQSLNPNPKLGYGLVQWTPSNNFTDWADSKGYAHDDGNAQCEWINTQTVPTGQWIPTTQYPMSFEEFKTSSQKPEYLADVFLKNFERPGGEDPERQENARYWYNWYNGSYVPPPNPPMNGGEWSASLPIWMYVKKKGV